MSAINRILCELVNGYWASFSSNRIALRRYWRRFSNSYWIFWWGGASQSCINRDSPLTSFCIIITIIKIWRNKSALNNRVNLSVLRKIICVPRNLIEIGTGDFICAYRILSKNIRILRSHKCHVILNVPIVTIINGCDFVTFRLCLRSSNNICCRRWAKFCKLYLLIWILAITTDRHEKLNYKKWNNCELKKKS